MDTACVSQSNSAKKVRNLCKTSSGVVNSSWNALSTYSTSVSSAYVEMSAWCAPKTRDS